MMDSKTINLNLLSNANLNVSDAYIKLGGDNTESITVTGVANTENGLPTWTWTTTYWSRVDMKNPNATLNIKNMNLTSSQTSGTWNSYDVTFMCNVNIEDVNFSKAVALDGEDKKSVLKNVSINETHDYYALWIAANGQNVTIDGLNVTSAGRGIKIDEQYVDDVKLTELSVAKAKFDTKNKAAIMVKSEAGANITLSKIDLSKVAADTKNAVWVDADAAAHFNKVIVNGGTKHQEE